MKIDMALRDWPKNMIGAIQNKKLVRHRAEFTFPKNLPQHHTTQFAGSSLLLYIVLHLL
jgi:hypothetical protein